MTPDQYCQEKAASSGSSFYNSFRFLPQQKRQAITALYAFCREVDDVVDECHDPQIARTKLAWWREEIANTFAGKPHHPVGQALLPAIRAFDLPMEQFFEIIDGMEMDLNSNRYADFKALQLYCYRVASVVGLLGGGDIRLQQPPDHKVCARSRPGFPAHQHHPRRGRRCAPQPHLFAAR